jgi:hypothetical protein
VNKGNPYELAFQTFVTWFGGKVLPEAADGKTADYLFESHNVIAELKTMLNDSTAEIDAKVLAIVQDWRKQTGKYPPSHHEGDKRIFEIKNMPEEIAGKWHKILIASVEHNIGEANRQIRETKRRENRPDAKGLVLIHNPRNPYFNDPHSYERLIVHVLRKKKDDKTLRFPHLHGAVYFSSNDIMTRDGDMYFWNALQMNRDGVSSEVQAFQNELRQGWYTFIKETYGVTVRQHDKDGNRVDIL